MPRTFLRTGPIAGPSLAVCMLMSTKMVRKGTSVHKALTKYHTGRLTSFHVQRVCVSRQILTRCSSVCAGVPESSFSARCSLPSRSSSSSSSAFFFIILASYWSCSMSSCVKTSERSGGCSAPHSCHKGWTSSPGMTKAENVGHLKVARKCTLYVQHAYELG